MRTLLGTLMWLALSCGPPSAQPARRDEILGGAADGSATSVFLIDLRFDVSASICSAVLISPRVLLTAAHCIDPVFHGASSLTARATNRPDTVGLMQSDMIDVTVMRRHPMWNPADQQSDYDLAVVLLASAPSGVTTPALLRALPANAVGQTLRVVGYGRASVNDGASSGTRRTVSLPITAVTAADLSFGSNGAAGICAGDSGGPSFLGAAVAGIHSRTEGSSCGLGVDIRVDRHLAFIDAFVAANDPPSCLGDGRCAPGCGTTDPDCGCQADLRCEASCGLSDPDCADDGAVCMQAAQCAGAQCVEDPRGFRFCSRSCAASTECLNDMTCQGDVCRAPLDTSKGEGVKGGCAGAPGLAAWLLLMLLRRRPLKTTRAGT